ncbi:hypothetical protein D4764_16G0001700 [Takifugu flavidus]|uniref:Uncharacterized protein n=1 Tax=Takifugu flavidus TaxID=433684 RepID=A0A5C6NWL0_9TELE|nr:hypothetical protein D4764_16G0001700 [Takifugu flavidus]
MSTKARLGIEDRPIRTLTELQDRDTES